MAKKSKNNFLLYGLLAVGGYFAYDYWKKNEGASVTATTTTPLLGPATAGSPTESPIDTTPVNQTAVISPVETISTQTAAAIPAGNPVDINGKPLPAGITQQVYNTVYGWAKSDGRIPVMQFAAALIPSEYNGLYDLITNDWNKSGMATPPQVAFWDNLRKKYDPNHVSW